VQRNPKLEEFEDGKIRYHRRNFNSRSKFQDKEHLCDRWNECHLLLFVHRDF